MSQEAERLPPIAPEQLTQEQRAALDAFVSGRRGALFGPFIALLRSPELLNRSQHLGEYLRYDSAVPVRLRELAILITARHFDQAYEWHVHAPAALAAGLTPAVLGELAAAERPAALGPDERAVYEFCRELNATHRVCDETYAAALAHLGECGLLDLIGICGYYGLLALVMNVARTALPEGATPFAQPSTRESSAR
jgi:4-carboxymuconolactone decarboxylase